MDRRRSTGTSAVEGALSAASIAFVAACAGENALNGPGKSTKVLSDCIHWRLFSHRCQNICQVRAEPRLGAS